MPVNPDAPGFSPGAVPSRPDPRDYSYAEIAAGAPQFDWKKGYDLEHELEVKFKVKDQNGSFSCGGQAWAYYIAALEAAFSNTLEERSAKYIYAQTFSPFGGGSSGRDNSEVVRKQGCARESVLSSYDNGKPPKEAFMTRPQDITDAMRADAKLSRALSYARVNTDVDSIAQAVRDNYGVVIGICGSDNGTWRSERPKYPHYGQKIWRHWLFVGKAKLIKGEKCLGVINSWGTDVGDDGWQWISEEYVEALIKDTVLDISQQGVWEAWTMVFNPNPPEADFKHHFSQELHYGDKSDEVVALQKALQIDGVFPSTVPTTGYYGTITRRAVLDFQIKYQVAPLAELYSLAGKLVGVKTRAQLNKLFDV